MERSRRDFAGTNLALWSRRCDLGTIERAARSWRDQDDEIRGDDLTQRRMARLGLGQWVELNGASLISLSPVSLRALSISLSLVSKSGNGLKVKYKSKMISGSKLNILRSTENIFWKIYISCATKHPHLRKSISESDLKPKQTQP